MQNYCNIFSHCSNLIDYRDCRTEVELCFEKGGESVEGSLDENVLEVIPNELQCKPDCRSNSSCLAYTYHESFDPLSRAYCFLMTHIAGPAQDCKHCITGFPDYRNITTGVCLGLSVESHPTPVASYSFRSGPQMFPLPSWENPTVR